MATAAQVLSGVDAAVSTVSSALPVLMAAYAGFKAIWMSTHPGATETDYIAYLEQAAQRGHEFNAAWLTANGYALQPDGSWKVAPAG